MKIIYIAHPVSGDIKGNLKKVAQIGREINLNEPDIVPLSQFFFDCHCLDDSILEERERGIKNDVAILTSGLIDEVRLYGDRISKGMESEINLATELNIPIRPMTKETKTGYGKIKAI